jgi:hypothetical protein
MAERTFAGPGETLSLFKDKAAFFTDGRGNQEMPVIFVRCRPDMLEVADDLLFRNPNGYGYLLCGKGMMFQECYY